MKRFKFLRLFALSVSTSISMATPMWASAAPLIGEKAPELIDAKNQNGQAVKLADSKGKWVLLFFYPKDDTPGCTKQACTLRDNFSQFKKENIVIYGVSRQGKESHQAFQKKHKLPYDLIMDESGKIGELFQIDSIPILGIFKRQSVLIDPAGIVVKKFEAVDPENHAKEVLEFVRKSVVQ